MLEWPSLLATLAIETPVNNNSEACVWRRPWIDMTGILHFLQCLLRISFTVELYTFVFAKIG